MEERPWVSRKLYLRFNSTAFAEFAIFYDSLYLLQNESTIVAKLQPSSSEKTAVTMLTCFDCYTIFGSGYDSGIEAALGLLS